MKKIIFISIIQFSFIFCQVFESNNLKKIPDNWKKSIEVTLDISKQDIFEGEDIVLFMYLKNISNKTLLIPLKYVNPLLKNVDENKIEYNFFFNYNSYIVLVPGEKATLTYFGYSFFHRYNYSTKLRGFPEGEYVFYSVLEPDNKINFKVNKVSDEKSFNFVKDMMNARFKKELDKEQYYKGVFEQLDKISDPVCKSIISSEYKYILLVNSARIGKTTIDEVKVFIKEYPQFAQSIELLNFLKMNFPGMDYISLLDENYVNKLEVKGLKNFINWKKFEIDNSEWRLEEKMKIYDEYTKIKRISK